MEDFSMLVLGRKPHQSIRIEGPSVVTVVSVRGNCVRIGIDASDDVRIMRAELPARPEVILDEPTVETEVGADIKRTIAP
jgi:carbon storage regulator CsrA